MTFLVQFGHCLLEMLIKTGQYYCPPLPHHQLHPYQPQNASQAHPLPISSSSTTTSSVASDLKPKRIGTPSTPLAASSLPLGSKH
ncbi:hypothetical protein PanWU01x14_041920 [Parasponia andersonii]|uniref:Uncharacterized protein n=1 Tax=Parasponia andersonii TaxID=3476 RepID=A0A2P5DQK7_PARAD|nr:hypothetical protein PanWU01x14_041920 [Parasponia andersonii]